jgi:hypothetical protein
MLNAFVSPIQILIARHVPGVPYWPAIVSSAMGILLLATMASVRKRRSLAIASAIFFVNALVTLWAISVDNQHYAISGAPWAPYQANKLGSLAAALLAPQWWVGVAAIAGYVLGAVLQLAALPDSERLLVASGEAWIMAAYGIFALAVLAFRSRQQDLERKLVRANAEADAYARFARTLAAVRDLSNTPLQIIRFSAALIRREEASPSVPIERIDRAVDSLAELSRMLERYEREFSPAESFDPRATLDRTE